MILWKGIQGKSEIFKKLLKEITVETIQYIKISHPLIRNFYIEWMEDLGDNVKIVLEKVLEVALEFLDFNIYM